MSPRQKSDDPGRNLREVWLGPEGAWRWPFDATMPEWIVAIATFIIGFFVLWFILPLVTIILLTAWAGARWVNRIFRKRHGIWYGPFIIGLFVALIPSPAAWLLPMSWWMAIPGAVIIAVMLVRKARPYLDGNRTFRYWLNTLQQVAAGPRPRRPLAIIAPAEFEIDPEADTDDMDDAKAKFMHAALTTDMEEIRVARYVRTEEVEAALWAPSQGRAETSTNVVAWLHERGVPYDIKNVSYRRINAEVEVLNGADLFINGRFVADNIVITRCVRTGAVTLYSRRDFAENHMPAEELAR